MALVANNDYAQTTGSAVTVNVLANDTLDGAPVSLSELVGLPVIVAPPAVGTAIVNGDGTITYTPPADFSGVTTVEYEIEVLDPSGCMEAHASGLGTPLVVETPLPGWWQEAVETFYLEVRPEPDDGSWSIQFEWDGSSAFVWTWSTGSVPTNQMIEGTVSYYDEELHPYCIHFTYLAA